MVRLLILLLAATLTAQSPTEFQPGAELQIRLVTPVSTTESRPGDPIEAVVIAPLVERTVLRGRVGSVRGEGPETRPMLHLEFEEGRILAVDNSRETVDSSGRIVGILRSETLTAQMDAGLEKLAADMPEVAAVLGLAKGLIVREADPEIVYPAGTELRLRLSKSMQLRPHRRSTPAAASRELRDLVQAQPVVTMAERPRLPSDLTNLMFIGSQRDLESAFRSAGWTSARKLDTDSVMETVRAIIEGRGYHEAPVSTLLLDGRPPDFVFQKTTNTFVKRHHIRIWKRPGQYEGSDVWVGAATHDIDVAFAADERTFYHVIDPEIDRERDKVVTDLIFTDKAAPLGLISRPDAPSEARNATGDLMRTDTRMAVLRVTS